MAAVRPFVRPEPDFFTGTSDPASATRFRSQIPSEDFPADAQRYVLYVNIACPWSHRTILAHALKGLGDIVHIVEADARDPVHGWYFSGQRGPERDPFGGYKFVREMYEKADKDYKGRVTIPFLWDRKYDTLVNNSSTDIMHMLIHSFDVYLPPSSRESSKGALALHPAHLSASLSHFATWTHAITNGVYAVGFAPTQAAYTAHVVRLFNALDKLELHLRDPEHRPYLFGAAITTADICMFATLIRFDVVYYGLFRCNLKMVRTDYPRVHKWLRGLYWGLGDEMGRGVFGRTTSFDVIKKGYAEVMVGNGVVPIGPVPNIMPL